ncbi:hypothetical protein J1605_014205 [Eschrichtius robustus]|uniref:Eukaryotic translation initiation factor 4E-binding protein 1 n=1 Tax=Eschrichtius robustus TaxID=9764 RepID=A0AB34GCX5_ESCRO|nr:hypothetical protein J1605_014205 [Eschrichtius robustus]
MRQRVTLDQHLQPLLLSLAGTVASPAGSHFLSPYAGHVPSSGRPRQPCTRIIYDRKFLMECRNSPVTKTPPRDLPTIPGVTSPVGGEPPPEAGQDHLSSSPEDKPAGGEESQFEMDI